MARHFINLRAAGAISIVPFIAGILLFSASTATAATPPALDGKTLEISARFAASTCNKETKDRVEWLIQSGFFRTKLVESLRVAGNLPGTGGAATPEPAGVTAQKAIELATAVMQKRYIGGSPDNTNVRDGGNGGFIVDFIFRTPGNYSRTSYFSVTISRDGTVLGSNELKG